MDVLKKFGLRVRQLREAQSLSQEEFAELADIHRTYISGIERGVRNPTLTVLERIARGFCITLQELLQGVAPN